MRRPDAPDTSKPRILLVVSSVLVLLGFLLSFGGGIHPRGGETEMPAVLEALLTWVPPALLVAGLAFALASLAMLLLDWFHRRS